MPPWRNKTKAFVFMTLLALASQLRFLWNDLNQNLEGVAAETQPACSNGNCGATNASGFHDTNQTTRVWNNTTITATDETSASAILPPDDWLEDIDNSTRSIQGLLVEQGLVDENSQNRWNPRRFSDNTTLNIHRGMNIISLFSGYQMAAWVYDGEKPLESSSVMEERHNRKWIEEPYQKLLRTKDDAKRMAPGDTLYVSHSKLLEWTLDFLPYIETDFVLISTAWPVMYPTFVEGIAPNITNHPNMLGWFCTNIQNYTGGEHYHPKVHPFPLGLKDKLGVGVRASKHRNPVPEYRKAFLETTFRNKSMMITKTRKVYAGPLGIDDTRKGREAIPQSGEEKLPYAEFLAEIAKSKYVLSPNGDHPDCHRHYEAIGLGTIPITELDPFLYRHLREGSVVYRNTNWNMRWLEETLPEPAPVNRNLVFEEYWMEYIERTVGQPLQWWDKLISQKNKLVDFADAEGKDSMWARIDFQKTSPNSKLVDWLVNQ